MSGLYVYQQKRKLTLCSSFQPVCWLCGMHCISILFVCIYPSLVWSLPDILVCISSDIFAEVWTLSRHVTDLRLLFLAVKVLASTSPLTLLPQNPTLSSPYHPMLLLPSSKTVNIMDVASVTSPIGLWTAVLKPACILAVTILVFRSQKWLY